MVWSLKNWSLRWQPVKLSSNIPKTGAGRVALRLVLWAQSPSILSAEKTTLGIWF